MHNVYRPRADHFQVCCRCHGGCAWEVFGPAGFLESWSANPRTVATFFRFAANVGSSITLGVHHVQSHTQSARHRPNRQPPLNRRHQSHSSHTSLHVHRQPRAGRRNPPGSRLRIAGLGQCHDHRPGRSSGRTEPQLPARHRASHHAGRTGGEPDAGSIYGVELDKEGDDMSPSCIFHWDWLDKNYIWPLSILISSSRLDNVSRMATPSCSRGMFLALNLIQSLWLLS